ncbi:uncharacterized protein LOC129780305 [Toxorhynchites rutilus septentrionalis]|uniref:uncharacterized protein LOC129780305 n=1 Tax=Toxorhynchites rutilus septentrionalis TaxID=329112 RepID=UPI002478B33E|nr:uncharacterized protein LOC129780305 [Toxorhynchites rutilus septentrionalis]
MTIQECFFVIYQLPDNPEELYNYLIDLDDDAFENLVSTNDINFVIVPPSGGDSDVDAGDSDSEDGPSGFGKQVNVESNIERGQSQEYSSYSSKKRRARHWEK